MGFLLSKLLPLLVYPLGAGLLLMGLGLLGRRRRWGPGLSGAGLALIWLASMPWLSRQLVRSLEEQAVRLTPASLPNADAVLVLGGGLLPPLAPRRGVEVADGMAELEQAWRRFEAQQELEALRRRSQS